MLGINQGCAVSSNSVLDDSYLVSSLRTCNPSLVEDGVIAGGSSSDGLLHISLDSRDWLKGIGLPQFRLVVVEADSICLLVK